MSKKLGNVLSNSSLKTIRNSDFPLRNPLQVLWFTGWAV